MKIEHGEPIEGLQFHYLRVLREDVTTKRNNSNPHFWCRCKCGRITSVSRSNLLTAHTRSCGCLRHHHQIPPDLLEKNHA